MGVLREILIWQKMYRIDIVLFPLFVFGLGTGVSDLGFAQEIVSLGLNSFLFSTYTAFFFSTYFSFILLVCSFGDVTFF